MRLHFRIETPISSLMSCSQCIIANDNHYYSMHWLLHWCEILLLLNRKRNSSSILKLKFSMQKEAFSISLSSFFQQSQLLLFFKEPKSMCISIQWRICYHPSCSIVTHAHFWLSQGTSQILCSALVQTGLPFWNYDWAFIVKISWGFSFSLNVNAISSSCKVRILCLLRVRFFSPRHNTSNFGRCSQ